MGGWGRGRASFLFFSFSFSFSFFGGELVCLERFDGMNAVSYQCVFAVRGCEGKRRLGMKTRGAIGAWSSWFGLCCIVGEGGRGCW